MDEGNRKSLASSKHSAIIDGLRHSSGDVQEAALEAADEIFLSSQYDEAKEAVLSLLNKSLLNQSLASRRLTASALLVWSKIVSLRRDFTSNEMQVYIKTLLVGLNVGLKGGKQQLQRTKRSLAPGAAFAFGSVYGQTVQRKASSASLQSSRAESVAGVNRDTESAASGESETDQAGTNQEAKRTVSLCRIIRQRSIACLDVLMPKVVLVDWPRIVCESETGQACLLDVIDRDPALSNCVAACRACETLFLQGQAFGAFASANDRSRMSFTSLSSRIASIIVITRTRLIELLRTRPQPILMESVLRCLTTVVKATEKAKLRQSHEDALRPTALQYCASGDATIAIRAYTLLCTLKENNAARSEDRLADFLKRLQDDTLPAEVKAEAWSALSTAAESTPESRCLALQDLQSGDSHIRLAVARYVLAQKGLLMEEHVELLCKDDNPAVRALGADCLGYGHLSTDKLAQRLIGDIEPAVRAATVRAIGVRIQSGARYAEDVFIESLRDPSYLVRSRASWTLGNYCEAHPTSSLLRHCLELRGEDVRLAVHAIRGIGAVLANCGLAEATSASGDVLACLRWMSHILDKERDPKLRWNTCSALGRSLGSNNGETVLRTSRCDNIHVIDQLLNVACDDRIFKTRLAACSAIRTGLEHTTAAQQDKEAIRTRLLRSQTTLASQGQSASFSETQQHIVPLQSELDRILSIVT